MLCRRCSVFEYRGLRAARKMQRTERRFAEVQCSYRPSAEGRRTFAVSSLSSLTRVEVAWLRSRMKAKGVRQVEILCRCDLAPVVTGTLDMNETWDARAPAAGQACSTHLQSARCVKRSPDEHRLARPMSRVSVRNTVRRPQGTYRVAMTRSYPRQAWMWEFRPQAGKASHLPAGP